MSQFHNFSVNGQIYHTFGKNPVIGKGGSSVVYQVRKKGGNRGSLAYALKVVDLSPLESLNSIEAESIVHNEVELLIKLKNVPQVICLIDYELKENEKKLLVVLEKADADFSCEVFDALTYTKTINSDILREWWKKILEAVAAVHAKNVIHMDLKPTNFVRANGILKLIDFGISIQIPDGENSILQRNIWGTTDYMAPESFLYHSSLYDHEVSKATDVWSLGCFLYSLVYGSPPFYKLPEEKKIDAIIDKRHAIKFSSTDVDPMIIEILKSCLNRNPGKRPSVEQLLSHPYLKSRLRRVCWHGDKIMTNLTQKTLKILGSTIFLPLVKLTNSSLSVWYTFRIVLYSIVVCSILFNLICFHFFGSSLFH